MADIGMFGSVRKPTEHLVLSQARDVENSWVSQDGSPMEYKLSHDGFGPTSKGISHISHDIRYFHISQ
jgi:hypothetical protein